jgi:membrane peptidoglycan carboxypeptidase
MPPAARDEPGDVGRGILLPPYPGHVPFPPTTSARPSAPAPARLVYALVASVVTGLLLAGVAFPVIGGLGLTAKAGADEFLVLPDELEETPLAQRSRILAADGSLLAILYRENRVLAELRFIPDMTRKAFIAVEDARFYAHNGVDYKGTLRAAVENSQAGTVTQGGSTLTQQYVKNALLQAASTKAGQDAAREATLDRKLKEARYALAIERKFSKDEILERYLNIAYFGNGAYGIGTASTFYFGKPAKDLTLEEGALLAGIVQSPGRFDPVKAMSDPALMTRLLDRRNLVLRRMALEGFIPEVQRAQATAVKPEFQLRPVVSGCENPAVSAPFFCDYVRRVLEDTPVGLPLGKTREERQDRLLAGGLTIRTTLDPIAQKAAQTAADEQIPREDPYQAATAINSVEPGTGDVKAMAVNRWFSEQKKPGHTKVNLALGGSSGMQAGSTFKPFVLTAALQQGLPLGLSLYSPNKYTSDVFLNYTAEGTEPYTLGNAGDTDTGGGTYDLRSGTWNSVNTFYVQLAERVDVQAPPALAESLGVKQFKNGSPTEPLLRGGAFTLGVNEVSPLSMAGVYATFAARGLYCPPRAVTEILDSKNQPIPITNEPCKQVIEQGIADTVNSVLQGVIARGTGKSAGIGRPAAGKTGSTNGSRAAWFAGYTPDLATTVWVGKPQPEDMKGVRINGRYYRQVYGGTIPAAIWRETMRAALEGVPETPFERADQDVVLGEEVEVPDVRGLPYDVARATLTEAGFGIRDGGRVSAAPVPRGDIAYTSPRAGRTVRTGTTITLYTSNGRERVVEQAPAPAPEPAPAQESPPESTTAAGPGNGNGNGKGKKNGG